MNRKISLAHPTLEKLLLFLVQEEKNAIKHIENIRNGKRSCIGLNNKWKRQMMNIMNDFYNHSILIDDFYLSMINISDARNHDLYFEDEAPDGTTFVSSTWNNLKQSLKIYTKRTKVKEVIDTRRNNKSVQAWLNAKKLNMSKLKVISSKRSKVRRVSTKPVKTVLSKRKVKR